MTFAPGVTEAFVMVMTQDDSISEGDEVFEARLFNSIAATIGIPFKASVTIVDNDGE